MKKIKKLAPIAVPHEPLSSESPAIWPFWLLAIMASAAYIPSIRYPFQFDDLANILKLFNIRHYTFANIFFKNSRWISYWLNAFFYRIDGFSPWVYRTGNIAIHVTIGFFVYLLTSYIARHLPVIGQKKIPSWLFPYVVTGLFLLHPVQTQTVSYVIQGQLEGLATLSIVLMLWLLIKVSEPTSWRVAWTVLLCVVAALSCGTKEIAIVGPLLLLIFDWFWIARGSIVGLKKRLWIHVLVWAIVLIGYLWLMKPAFFVNLFGLSLKTYNNWGNKLTENPTEAITALHFCISEFKVILHYLWIFIWPVGISVDYDWKLVSSFWAIDCLIPFMLLCSLGLYIYGRLRRNSTDPISFGLLWFFVAIMPRASILPSSELVADYKTYLGSIGLLGACGVVGLIMSESLSQNKIFVLWTFFFVMLGAGLYTRNTVWRTAPEFWYNIVINAPGKARAWNNYGVSLSESGKQREAIDQFIKAIDLEPQYADPYGNMAVAFGVLKEFDKAITAQSHCIRLNPMQPEGYNNLASFLLHKHEPEKALKALERAIELRPHYGKAYFNMGRAYYELKNREKAWECFKKACTEADLDNFCGFDAYARASMALGKFDDARVACERLLALQPNAPEPVKHLANMHFMKREYADACRYYEVIAQGCPEDVTSLFQLGDCYSGQDDYARALDIYHQVIAKDTGFAIAYLRVARCLDKLDRRSEAIEWLEKFIAMAPPKKFVDLAKQALHKMRF